MLQLSRRARGNKCAVAATLAVVGVFALVTKGSSPTVVYAQPSNDQSGSAEPSTSLAPETTTTTEVPPTTTTTVAAPVTTAVHNAVVTTTTAVTVAPRPKPIADNSTPPTTPCTWTYDLWPAENMPTPGLYLHLSAFDKPNTVIAITLYEHGTTNRIDGKVDRSNGNGHIDAGFALPSKYVGQQIDVTASMVIGNQTGWCDPKPWSPTLNMTM
jgi:hypothetical protein